MAKNGHVGINQFGDGEARALAPGYYILSLKINGTTAAQRAVVK